MNPIAAAAGTVADTWDVLDRLVEDVAQLSRTDPTPEAFGHELLRRSVDALAALGGVAWEVQTGDVIFQAAYASPSAATDLSRRLAQSSLDPARRELLRRLIARGEPWEAAPSAVVDPAANLVNPYEAAWVAAPVVVDRTTIGILELVLRPDVGADARQGALRLLCALAECAADFYRERQRRLWQHRASAAREFEDLVTALYAELDPTSVAFAAVNEGRRWAECDRVSLLFCDAANARASAVSGSDAVDRRSDQIRLLERLVTAVARQGEPLWYDGRPAETLVPEVAEALSNYVDQSDAAAVVILPITDRDERDDEVAATAIRPRSQLAAVVFEWFSGATTLDELRRARLHTLQLHTGRALRRACECDSVPFGRFWRRRYRRRALRPSPWRKLAWVAIVMGLVIGVPFFIPAEATVEARGSLEPERRRELFAPTDGIVAEISVRHGQTVAVGDPLIVLRSPALTLELTRVAGEIQTTERRLTALRAARVVSNPNDAATRLQVQERSAEEEQLKETLRGLEEQRRLLLQQVEDLTVRAPIAGIVTTWDVERILLGRPVARGQSLLGLADAAGLWIVELHVADRLIGDVLAARRTQSEPLAVEFVTATHPETVYRGRLLHVAEAAEVDSALGVVVKTTVAIDGRDLDSTQLRPGAAVTARICCGPSSLAAVGGRDVGRFLQSLWW